MNLLQSGTVFIFQDHTLTIKGFSLSRKLFFISKVFILLFIIGFCVYRQFVNPFIVLAFLFPIIFTFKGFLRIPVNFFDIVIVKSPDGLFINKKFFPFEDLIFLSIRESEEYGVIRLEAKRKNILFENQKTLVANIESFERAVSLSRQLRDFISLDLKINNITMGFSAPRLWRGYFEMGGGKSADVENWNFIE